MTDPTIKDLLLAIQTSEANITTALNNLINAGVKVDQTAVLAAISGVQSTANQILAQDQPTPVNPPVVTSISPSNAPAVGGTVITVTGSNLLGSTGVLVGTVPATNVVVANDTTLSFTNPAQPAGVEDVTVVGPGGTSAIVAGDKLTLA